jgi:hypothetical protein
MLVGAIGLLCVGATGVAAAVAALLIDNEGGNGTIMAGAAVLEIGPSTLPVAIFDLLPGEVVQHTLDLENSGSIALGRVQLEVSAQPAPSDANSFQLSVERCSSAWLTGTVDGKPVATCAQPSTPLVAVRPLLGRSELDVVQLDSDVPGGIDHLRLQIGLAEQADPSLAGDTFVVTVSFPASQRQGILR